MYLVLFYLLDFLLCWCNKAGITVWPLFVQRRLQMEVIQMRNRDPKHSSAFPERGLFLRCETYIVFAMLKVSVSGNWKSQRNHLYPLVLTLTTEHSCSNTLFHWAEKCCIKRQTHTGMCANVRYRSAHCKGWWVLSFPVQHFSGSHLCFWV